MENSPELNHLRLSDGRNFFSLTRAQKTAILCANRAVGFLTTLPFKIRIGMDRDEPGWIGYLWEFCSVFFSWGRGRLPGSVHQFHPESSNLSQVVGSREGTSFLSEIFGPKSIVRDPYESQVTEFTSSLHHVPTTKDTLGIPLKLVSGKIHRHHANPPCLKRRNISKFQILVDLHWQSQWVSEPKLPLPGRFQEAASCRAFAPTTCPANLWRQAA